MPQSVLLGLPDNKENFKIINYLHLIFKYYLLKSGVPRKISLEVLKKNIINIYNIEKQQSFQRLKKRNKVKKK